MALSMRYLERFNPVRIILGRRSTCTFEAQTRPIVTCFAHRRACTWITRRWRPTLCHTYARPGGCCACLYIHA